MDVQEYASQHLEVLKDNSPELQCVCPFCGDQRGKFQFNVQKAVGRCWRASCGGVLTLVQLIVKSEGVAVHVAIRKSQELKSQSPYVPQQTWKTEDRGSIGSLPSGCIPLSQIESSWASCSPEEKQILHYGMTYLHHKRRMDTEILAGEQVAIGVNGEWMGRIVFPAIEDTQIVSFTARAIEVQAGAYWMMLPGVVGQKYKHASNTDGYLDKRSVVFGIDLIRWSPKIVVVEDVFSVVCLSLAGYPSISFWGTDVTQDQMVKLKAKWNPTGTPEIIILLDSDAKSKWTKMSKSLGKFFGNVKIGELTGPDADEDIQGAIVAIEAAKSLSLEDEIGRLLHA